MLLTGSTAGSTAVWSTVVFFASYAAENMPPRIDPCLTSRPRHRALRCDIDAAHWRADRPLRCGLRFA